MVAQITGSTLQDWTLQARALEALDALAGRYEVHVWRGMEDIPRDKGGHRNTSQALARALLRRWDELPEKTRSQVIEILRSMDTDDVRALQSALLVNGWGNAL